MVEKSWFTNSVKVFLVLCLLGCSRQAAAKNMLDFSDCVIVAPPQLGKVEDKAVFVLQEEIEKRTGIQLVRIDRLPDEANAVIAVGLQSQMAQFQVLFRHDNLAVGAEATEGFSLLVQGPPRQSAIVAGKDARGVLYGVGRLLRRMELRQGSILVPEGSSIVTAPRNPLRGHQLGYRPKTNSYDAWSPAQYDQYIRELALFGSNAIEIIPPVSDDDYISRHMADPMETMIKHTEIIDSYGLDVWIWYPNVGKDYKSDSGIEKELAEREEVFKKLKRIDHILIPAGDPGRLHPDVFFPFAEKVAKILAKYHPKSRIWASPQAMHPTREWLSSFYEHVNKKPAWLGGVVFAPWIKTPLPKMRQIVDKQYKIRRYPDITHNVACQYPVRNWDLALALTLHRECFNPRPVAMKVIHNAFDKYACGSLTYSEGIHDDINKFVWGDQDWDPSMSVIETLRDYCRLYISPDFAEGLAQGFMAQERNWEGPLATNDQVDITLRQWQDLEKKVPEHVRNNYRFQMGLLRAYYDAYIKRRLIHETELEANAIEVLRFAQDIGALKAVAEAEKILQKAKTEPVAVDYKRKCEALSDSLYELIGCQLTVKKHGAKHRTRGAFMDGIDEPLNNVNWLTSQFKEIRSLGGEPAKIEAIDKVVNRTNPGPAGFYDNMGSATSLRRIVNNVAWEDDPGTLMSPRIAFYYRVDDDEDRDIPMAWKNQVCTIYETPLKLAYDDLDPEATYRVRVTYKGKRGKMVRLHADDDYQIHDLVKTQDPPIREFPIPKEATQDGRLELKWTCDEGRRGSQVCEIWLMKDNAEN
ncbi:MAG: hypothetical protein ACYTEL_03865 [Planctomycetota bacterium]|jgi:hypothetical protein